MLARRSAPKDTLDSSSEAAIFNEQSVYFARNIKKAWRFNAFLMVFL